MGLRPHHARRLSRREVRMELASGTLLAAVVAGIALGFEDARPADALDLAGLILLAVACSHVRLYIGGGYGVPTQFALVPMLYVLPPALVPVAMLAGSCGAAAVDVAVGRAHPDRILPGIGDAWHAVGPAIVFAVAGAPDPEADTWVLLIPSFIAQAAGDAASGVLREWLGRGIPPILQLRVMGLVYGLDLMLTPIAFLAVLAPVAHHRGWVLLAPLTALLAGLVVDRRRRIEEETARAEELQRERARLQAVLRRVGRAMAAGLDEKAVMAAVRDIAEEAIDGSVAFAGAPGARGGPRAALGEAARAAARDGGPVVLESEDWHAVGERLGRCGTDEVLAIARRGTAFSAEELELLHHLAVHAAVSLENARLHARVREQATIDELTGLANHRTLQQVLSDQLTGGERFTPRLSLVLMDIDDFKLVNDTWGHLQGDRVLREVAAAIRARCRSVDLPARYGGEELAVALPRTDAEGALRMAEDLRRSVADLVIENPDGPATRVTVSVGVATAPESGTTPGGLVAAADRALYEAKRAGKDRVVPALAPAPAVH